MIKKTATVAGLLLTVLLSLCQLSCSSGSTAPRPTVVLREPTGNTTDYQVVVYGATAGGAVAAIAAAREGRRVALLEPGKHVGGMVSGGLGYTDFGNQTVIGGMSREFFQRVGNYYGTGIGWQFEPHAAEQVLIQWLNEAGVDVFLENRLSVVQKQDLRIVSIGTENGHSFNGLVFIDSSYEGDLMAKAGVSYSVGREAAASYSETLAGAQPSSTQHQFNLPVSPYDASGNLLPLVTGATLAAAGTADNKVQAYTYRLCMTMNRANQVPFPRPTGYDASQYEVLRRYLAQVGGDARLGNFLYLAPVPNGKTDTNNNGPISTDFIGQSWLYPDADYNQRAQIAEQHKRYVQGLLYFLANDPSVPAGLQGEINQWGLAKDEFVDNGNWPYQLYIREARRMQGVYVMTQQDLQVTLAKSDSIGMGSYNSDSHHVQRVATPQGLKNEGLVGVAVQPYSIPYRSLTPKAVECENLLVPVCLSASHVAYSSLRMEPQYMILGQAAGVAAHLAIQGGTSVQGITVGELQARLLSLGQILSQTGPTSGAVYDNRDAVITGSWTASSSVPGFLGSDYLHDSNAGKGTKSVRFVPFIPTTGSYEVQVSYTANANRAANVPVRISAADPPSTVLLDQRIAPGAAAPFVSLGTFNFLAGTGGYLEISNLGTNGFVVVDAVRIIPVR